jgi:autotransporter-associated beta strand protein
VKQGDGTLVLPNVTETYSGPTDVWAGKLQFDGMMQNSRVWLNRHTTLISNGSFPKGIQADYNATILPGGKEKIGTITVGDLSLGFGSRIVFDVKDGENDKVNVTTLVIEKKNWPKGGGPAYNAPVFRIEGNPATGEYLLGEVAALIGNIEDVIIEGLSGKKSTLSYEGGNLKLTVVDYKAKDLTWTGSVDGK